jgi:hypothetical protein
MRSRSGLLFRGAVAICLLVMDCPVDTLPWSPRSRTTPKSCLWKHPWRRFPHCFIKFVQENIASKGCGSGATGPVADMGQPLPAEKLQPAQQAQQTAQQAKRGASSQRSRPSKKPRASHTPEPRRVPLPCSMLPEDHETAAFLEKSKASRSSRCCSDAPVQEGIGAIIGDHAYRTNGMCCMGRALDI